MRRRECVAALASLLFAAWAASAARSAAAVSAELLEKATVQGSVRLIVHLKVREGAGAAAIESAKHALLAELAATRHRVSRDLVGLPALTLEASADTLRALAASSRVERVTEDAPRRPQR
jgi:hypothetical protein